MDDKSHFLIPGRERRTPKRLRSGSTTRPPCWAWRGDGLLLLQLRGHRGQAAAPADQHQVQLPKLSCRLPLKPASFVRRQRPSLFNSNGKDRTYLMSKILCILITIWVITIKKVLKGLFCFGMQHSWRIRFAHSHHSNWLNLSSERDLNSRRQPLSPLPSVVTRSLVKGNSNVSLL